MIDATKRKIDTFFSKNRQQSYKKGHILLLNDQPVNYAYLLEEGHVKVYDVSKHGDEVILNVFKPPTYFPMSVAINKTNNPYIYQAETDIVVRQSPALDTVEFIQDNPDVMLDLLARVYRGTDELLGRMAHLMGGSAQSRLIYELLQESRRFGTKGANGSLNLALTESDLGARCGLSRETISRELRKLKDEKLVIVKPHGLSVIDVPGLESKLGSDL